MEKEHSLFFWRLQKQQKKTLEIRKAVKKKREKFVKKKETKKKKENEKGKRLRHLVKLLIEDHWTS